MSLITVYAIAPIPPTAAPLPVLDADWAPVADGVDTLPDPSLETPDPVRPSRANRDKTG